MRCKINKLLTLTLVNILLGIFCQQAIAENIFPPIQRRAHESHRAISQYIKQASDGILWFSASADTSNGPKPAYDQYLYAFNSITDKFRKYFIIAGNNARIDDFAIAPNGKIYFILGGSALTYTPLNVLDPKKGTIENIPVRIDIPRDLVFDHNGNIFMTTQDGIVKLDSGTYHATTYNVPQASSLAVDSHNNIWFAMPNYREIAELTSTGEMKTYTLDNSLVRPFRVIVDPNGDIWGLQVGGVTPNQVFKFNPSNGTYKYYAGFPNNFEARDIAITSNGTVWIASNRNIIELNPSTGKLNISPDTAVGRMLAGLDNTIWFTKGTEEYDLLGEIQSSFF